MREYGFTNYVDIGRTGQKVPMDSLSPEELKKVVLCRNRQWRCRNEKERQDRLRAVGKDKQCNQKQLSTSPQWRAL